jgi:acetyl-CoA hydrolase
MSAEFLSRIRKKSLHSKIMTAEDTIPFFKNGMDLGWSGFTPVGYLKLAITDLKAKTKLPPTRGRENNQGENHVKC